MIQLKGTNPTGTPCYFLCLSGEEMTKIIFEEMPLLVKLTDNAPGDLEVIIIYGRTDQEIIDNLAAKGITTSLAVDPADQS